MSLWGTAIDAEVQYRREELAKTWPRKAAKDRKRAARKPAEKRAAQIRRGLSGMRPASA